MDSARRAAYTAVAMPTETAISGTRIRWWVLAAVIGVSIMTPIDSSALNIAITPIRNEFHETLSLVAWVPLVYLVVIASLLLPLGRLGDLYGFRRLFLTGVVIFTLASAWCGFSPGLGWLIGGRVVQGVGACLMMALSSGIITAVFPRQERGRALGFMGMGIAVGLVLGPTLGGLLIQWQNWRWIFFINLPIGLFGGLFCWRMLPPLAPHLRRRIDWPGAVLAIVMLGSFLLAITQGQEWGWASPPILWLFAATLAALLLFLIVEQRLEAPMLELSLFRHPVFAGANIAAMLNYLGQFCVIFLTPVLMQSVLRAPPERAGLVMGALPLAVLVLAPVSGALSDRLGTRLLAITGETLLSLSMLGMAFVEHFGRIAPIVAMLMLAGIGAGLFQSPNNSAIMGSIPRAHLGIGGSVLATMRNLGMALGIALSTAVVSIVQSHYLHAHPGAFIPALSQGIRSGYIIGAFVVFLGALTSIAREDRLPSGAG